MNRKNKTNKFIEKLPKIFILTFSLVMFLFSFTNTHNVFLWDEAVYLSSAENLFEDEPYYTEIDYRPPLLPILIYIFDFIFEIETGAHIIISLFYALGIFSIYLVGKELHSKLIGISSAILFGLNPFIFHLSTKIMTNIASITLFLLSIYFLFKYFKDKKTLFLFISGAFFSLSVLMRFTTLVFSLLILLLIFLYNKEKKELMIKNLIRFGIGAFVVILPYFIWAQINFGFFLSPIIKAQIIVGGSEYINDILYYGKSIFRVGGFIAVVGLISYVIYLFRKFKKETFYKKELFLILWVLFFVLYITLNPHKELRYFIPALPAIYLLSSIGLFQFKQNSIKISIFILIFLMLLYPLKNITYFDGRMDLGESILLERTENLIEVSEYIKTNKSNEYVVYSNSYYSIIGFYSKQKVYSTWPWDERFYTDYQKVMKYDGWYIHYVDVNKKPDHEWLENNSKFTQIKNFSKVIIYQYNIE